MLEDSVYNLLSNDSSITDLVSTKIFPLAVSESVKEPYIIFQVLNIKREYTLQDVIGLTVAKVQISCWSSKYFNAVTIREAVRNCLNNYNGEVTATETTIQKIHLEDEGDLIDEDDGEEESRQYGKRLSFKVWFNE